MTARRLFALAALAAVLGTSAEASAQDAAAAEALFDEGKQLAAESRWAEACPKFAASQAAEPSVGTLLNWADCLEKEGKIGSALLRFREVEAQLSAASDERATIAAERRAALEPRAPRILIRSSTPPPLGVELALDGERVPLEGVAAAGVERIVDPGPHSVEIRRGAAVLERRDGDAREGVAFELALDLAAIDRAHAVAAPAPEKEPSKEPPSRATFALGWTLAATGGAALLVGGTLGLVALGAAGDSEETGRCVEQVCSPAGLDDVRTAGDLAEAGQWVGLAGVALVAVGVTLVLTAPSADEPTAARTARLVAAPGRLLVDGSF